MVPPCAAHPRGAGGTPGRARPVLWRAAFDEDLDGLVDAAGETVAFRLTPEQIHRAAVAAIQHARSEGRDVQPADLRRGARAQNASGLERLARRIEPRVAWDDLVLPGDVLEQLRRARVAGPPPRPRPRRVGHGREVRPRVAA